MFTISDPRPNRRCLGTKFAELISAIFLLTTVVGCDRGDRPLLGEVAGVVTVDGQPAAGMGVLFSQAGFRSSYGYTNENGEYELKYIRDTMGAVVGMNKVRIKYIVQEGRQRPRQLPEKYNRKTELSANVKPGSNVFNFALELPQ